MRRMINHRFGIVLFSLTCACGGTWPAFANPGDSSDNPWASLAVGTHCDAFLTCEREIAAADPSFTDNYKAANEGYGSSSPCWDSTSQAADECENACAELLKVDQLEYPSLCK
jgi:hypothetical protein